MTTDESVPAGRRYLLAAFWPVRDLADAFGVGLLGVGCLAVVVGLGPGMARLQAWPGRRLLPPSGDVDLSLRVARLTATRAAALDAHAAELRRIERSLHDGTQNRLVAVNVLLGAARRALARDPASADAMLGRAQDAAEQALAELRTVARGILPPVLADRGLAGALSSLAGTCGVPCRVDVDVPGRCVASVEATAYFVVAEALTNIAKHSGASSATVTVRRDRGRLLLRVNDDGHGGANEDGGSGLTGIRQRVEAYDGRLVITSPSGGPTTIQVELAAAIGMLYLFVIAVGLLGPWINRHGARLPAPALRTVWGDSGYLATANLRANARGMVTVLTALVLSVGFGGSVWFLQDNLQRQTVSQSHDGMLADRVLGSPAGLPDTVAADVRKIPGIRAVTAVRHT